MKKLHIQTLLKNKVHHDFQSIQTKVAQDRKKILAFFCYFVDDYFAMENFAITVEDFQACDNNKFIIEAIESGNCKIYKPEFIAANASGEHWLDCQSILYKEVYLCSQSDEDDYENIPKDFEGCVLEAFLNCDRLGFFGKRTENGIMLFAYYGDYYDGNGRDSLLEKTARILNSVERLQKLPIGSNV